MLNIGTLKNMLKPGSHWEHYKGGRYTVICMAMCSETGKDLVIYRSDEKRIVYARPYEMWNQIVQTEDRRGTTKRFTEIL